MGNTITIKELKKALDAFDCVKWKTNIQEILDASTNISNNTTIVIPEQYIEKLIKDGSTKQLAYCISLGFELLCEEAYKDLSEIFSKCKLQKTKHQKIWYDEDGGWMFILDKKEGYFWYSYTNIYVFFREKYIFREDIIHILIQSGVMKALKIQGVIPFYK